MVLLDVLERLGITRLVTRMLTPVLRLSGLEERAAPLTTVGVLLGLAYGGALIIEAAERENYSPRTRLLALSWLSLCHALIEDTLLILALGADVWVILVLRGLAIVTIAVLILKFTPLPQDPWWKQSKLLPTFENAALWLTTKLPPEVTRYLDFHTIASQIPPAPATNPAPPKPASSP